MQCKCNLKMPTCLVKQSAIMHWCCGQGRGHRETSSFGIPEKPSMMMDYPRRQQQAVSLITGQGLLAYMQSLRISLQAQRHQRIMPESCRIMKREFSGFTSDFQVKASCSLSFSKASMCVDMLRPIYPMCSLSTAVPWWCKI